MYRRVLALLAVALLLIVMVGCDQFKQEQKPVPQVQQPYQRFVPIPAQDMVGLPWTGTYALDSKTGQLCKAYVVEATGWVGRLPLCFDLYKQYPD